METVWPVVKKQSEQVPTLGWDGEAPAMFGALRITRWKDIYLV
jgi:hypothetical protein